MKRCPNCNHENAQANMYCERCGTLLAAPPEQTYASVNEAYTSSGEQSATTQDYYSPVPPPPPASRNGYHQASMEVPPPPPSAYYTPAPYVQAPAPNYSYADPLPVVRPRSFGAALLSSILYLVGAFCIAFGVAGFMLYGTSTTLVGFVFVALSIVALVGLVPLLIVRKQLVLKWWARVLIILGLTIAATVVLFIIAALNPAGSNYSSFGIVFIIYGFATGSVAFW